MARNTNRCPNIFASETELLADEVEKKLYIYIYIYILFSTQNSTVMDSMEKEA
jgi:hypothetical protein